MRIILNGAKIGKNCLIAAGALVTENAVIPDGSMVMGMPGKVKRELTEEDIKARFENGVLIVTVPKKDAEPIEEKKYITIEG